MSSYFKIRQIQQTPCIKKVIPVSSSVNNRVGSHILFLFGCQAKSWWFSQTLRFQHHSWVESWSLTWYRVYFSLWPPHPSIRGLAPFWNSICPAHYKLFHLQLCLELSLVYTFEKMRIKKLAFLHRKEKHYRFKEIE